MLPVKSFFCKRALLPLARRTSFIHKRAAILGGLRAKQDMAIESAELDRLQEAYKSAVDIWIAAIQYEEALASVNHSVAEIDQWEHAAEREEEARKKVKAAKAAYESALRQEFFNF